MKKDISKGLVKQLCNEYVDVILVGMEEYSEDFPYTLAVINFINTLYGKCEYINLEDFSERVRDCIYKEMTDYLAR